MAWLQEFHFLRPYWLLALIIPFLLGWKFWKNESIKSSWAEVCDEHLLKFLLIKGQNQERRYPFVLAVVICALTVVALSGPTWVKKENPALMVNNPVMLLLNMSSDMKKNDVTPSRAERAKFILKDLTEMLQSAEVGLIVYTHEPFMITPLTEDAAMVRHLLPALSEDIMPVNGDRLDRAIDLAVERMTAAGYHSGNVAVLTGDAGEKFDAALKSAAEAHHKGFDVSVIKINARPNDKLQQIAQKGGGVYINYNGDMRVLTQKISDLYAKELKKSENMQAVWDDMGYYLFWLPALLLLYYFRRGVLTVLLICLLSGTAHANWFLNDNQEAMRLFESKQYEAARQKFKDLHWRGAAAYKSGEYKEALKQFSAEEGLDALYNQGNALAKAGKIDEAIKKYEEVLAQDKDFEDARFNLEYLKRQQQQEQNQQQKSDQKEQNQDKQQGQSEQKQDQSQQQQEQQKQEQQEQQSGNQQQQQQNQQDQQQQDGNHQQSEEQKQSGGEDNQAQQEENQDNQNDSEKEDNSQSAGQSEQQSSAGKQENEQDSRSSDDKQNSNQQPQQSDNEGSDGQSQQQPQNQQPEGQEDSDKQQDAAAAMSDEQGEKEAQAMQGSVGKEEAPEEKEKYRARMQRFREIPEDKGGLLRAFILKEYRSNRYKD